MSAVMNVVFVLILAGAMIYGFVRYRHATRRDNARAEAGSKRLYAEEDAEESAIDQAAADAKPAKDKTPPPPR